MPGNETSCPECGVGTLVNLAFDERGGATGGPGQQRADSRQVSGYSCGHEVIGASLASADPERLDVERRTSDESLDPSPVAGGDEAR